MSLTKPISVKRAAIRPIALAKNSPGEGSAKGKPLMLNLHGRGGGVGVDSKGTPFGNYIVYSDDSFAWREGIPFKFQVQIDASMVSITPSDRVWIGRRLTPKESTDERDRVPAISTFWFGYSPDIAVSLNGPKYTCDNYTERYLLFLVKWAQKFLGTDPNRTYSLGGSMGGTGSVQLALHYPKVFAAVIAKVPIYSYTWRKTPKANTSVNRLRCSVGQFTEQNPAYFVKDGRDLLEVVSGERMIANPSVDYPPIFATNGRNDSSMPWANNPPFFKAAGEARQAIHIFWNNGAHGMSSEAPKDCQHSRSTLLKFATNQPFLAFSENSDDKNYGNGDQKDGDLVGWINRGISSSKIQEDKKHITATIKVEHPDIQYPVSAKVTFRRRQQFQPAAGSKLTVTINGKTSTMVMPADGILTVPVKFENAEPITVKVAQ